MRGNVHLLFTCLALFIVRIFASYKKRKTPKSSQRSGNNTKRIKSDDEGVLTKVTIQEQAQQALVKKEKFLKLFKKVMTEGRYDEIVKLSDNMNMEQFLKLMVPEMTTIEHCDGPEFVHRRDMIVHFLIHGKMAFVSKVIFEFTSCRSNYHYCYRDFAYQAIQLALNKDMHDRVVGLLEATKARYAVVDELCRRNGRQTQFDVFISDLFVSFAPEKDSLSLRRFLTIHGEEFKKAHGDMFEIFCQKLVSHLKNKFLDPSAKELLIGLIEHPSLLTPTIFASGYLCERSDVHQLEFVMYNWREAIARALEADYPGGDNNLWNTMMHKFEGQFPTVYPSLPETYVAILGRFKTKHELEEPWRQRKQKFTAALVEGTPLPFVLLGIITGYAPLLIAHADNMIA